LARNLRGHGIACDVVVPGLVPVRPGDRIKTDPRDARKLARLLAGGLLERDRGTERAGRGVARSGPGA
jgi:transposase